MSVRAGTAVRDRLTRFWLLASLLGISICLFSGSAATGQAPATPPSPQQPAPPAPSAAAPPAIPQTPSRPAPSAEPQSAPELKTQETPIPFHVRVNLVPVRVVVRDAQGHAVANLHKEDFQVKEGRTVQTISTFSTEVPGAPRAEAPKPAAAEAALADSATPPPNFQAPSRFVALLFDDVHVNIGDLQRVQLAANNYIDGQLKPTDRVAVLTMSGQTQVDFTDDRDKLHDMIRRLLPRPIIGGNTSGDGECPPVGYYQASQILNFNDSQAFHVAAQDALICAFEGNPQFITSAQALAQSTAFRVLELGNTQTQYAIRRIHEVIRRMTALPGQRSIVLVSPGFLYIRQELDLWETIDQATRANVVINTLDARGLYAVDPLGDVSQPVTGDRRLTGIHDSYRIENENRNTDVLIDLANGTGGISFRNSNDLNDGFRRLGGAPEVSYLLGISPANLKFNGQFHSLNVTLLTKDKYTVQARKGYYAPKKAESEEELAKQDIEDAVFSQEEQRTIPVELRTQFYKVDPMDAKLTVLGHVDVRRMHFDKSEGRNRDNLTMVTVLFDRNGNYITGSQKVVEFRLLDTTLERLNHSGVVLKTSFDVKPGPYVVRLVVRDSNGAQLSAQNSAVDIPY